jgi:hypothetical protein
VNLRQKLISTHSASSIAVVLIMTVSGCGGGGGQSTGAINSQAGTNIRLEVAGGNGTATVSAGDVVSITADPAETNYYFSHWSSQAPTIRLRPSPYQIQTRLILGLTFYPVLLLIQMYQLLVDGMKFYCKLFVTIMQGRLCTHEISSIYHRPCTMHGPPTDR